MANLFVPGLLFLLIFLSTEHARAAIGCTLSNPAKDLLGLYPAMATYLEEVKELHRFPNGAQLYQQLQDRLRSDLDPIYEGFETPYTLYTVFNKDRSIIGHVHGVNVAGKGGVIQIFLAVNPQTALIEKMVFQRIEGQGAKSLRSKDFRDLFQGISLADFYKHDYYQGQASMEKKDKLAKITCPPAISPAAIVDCQSTIQGVRKNLILLDFFLFNQRHEEYFRIGTAARDANRSKP